VFSLPNLHAKVFVFDNTAIIGSANVSRNSSSVLIEAALLTDERATVSQASALIESLKEKATIVDSEFISRISKIKVRARKGFGPLQKPKPKVGRLGGRTWILRVDEVGPSSFPNESEIAAQGEKLAARELLNRDHDVNWVRWRQSISWTRR
jgi:phosphatidylserine/phosphatidylglycerophosphate/cardiolipin synthase-like enzyme